MGFYAAVAHTHNTAAPAPADSIAHIPNNCDEMKTLSRKQPTRGFCLLSNRCMCPFSTSIELETSARPHCCAQTDSTSKNRSSSSCTLVTHFQ